MASDEQQRKQSKFQLHWEMYQNRLAASANNIPKSDANDQPVAAMARVPTTNGSSVAPAHASQAAPITVTSAKTFEQVYKDVLEKEFARDASRSHAVLSAFVADPKPSSSKKKEEYITTVYNITPRELPATSVSRHATTPGTILLNGTGLSDRTSKSYPSGSDTHQKPQSNTYGKQLPTLAFLPANHAASCQKQIYIPHLETADNTKAQQEIYRRLQLKQNAPQKGYNQTSDAIMVSKHHTNVMLAIVKPKVTSPAPTHVYGAPDVKTTAQQNQQLVKQYGSRLQLTETHRLQNAGNGKVTVEYINEPPPAHREVPEAPKATFTLATNITPSITLTPIPNGQSQDEALNLDTKHGIGKRRDVVQLIVLPSASSMRESLIRPTTVLGPSGKEILLAATSTSTREQPKPPTTTSTVIQSMRESFTRASMSTRDQLNQPTPVVNQRLKEILILPVHSSAREPIKQTLALNNSGMNQGIVPAASSSSPETLKQPTLNVNPSSHESLIATTSTNIAQKQVNQPAVTTNPIANKSPVTNNAKEPVKQSSPMVNQSALESLLKTAATSAIGQLNQTAILLNHSTTSSNPLATTSSNSTQEPLKQPTPTNNPSSQQSNPSTLIASTSLQIPVKQPADLTNTGTMLIVPGATSSSSPQMVTSVENGNTTKKVQNVTAVPSAYPFQANPAFWEQLRKLNMQNVLAHIIQANTAAQARTVNPPKGPNETVTQPTVLPPAVNSPMAKTTQAYETATTPPKQPPFEQSEYEQAIIQKIEAIKRKITPKDIDPTKKRRSNPKPKRPTDAFLQNGPCYAVASRLPRCRECGRSRAVRSRDASLIFCRFFAFRKLKYNNAGQLEVYGFADPVADAKDADTSLWSANLQKVPTDLSVEKCKFLLGQVGYKFCELFHEEKEAYFEHMAEDKTVAWKQAVQGVREMCDVCQTTLFNHHWVCSTCGFVVCIDCYKCRKNGIITVEQSAKDKDANGWLLCSATKEPHDQARLMLTQIIPSKCMYTLVRQMHGICALLEIPLNCECPLTREPLFRTIKDQLKFIYPLPPNAIDSAGGEVSVTIKHVEQMGMNGGKAVESSTSNGSTDAFDCRIVFTQQYKESRAHQQWGDSFAADETNESCAEKQSYSFDGFEQEIHTDGDHFDERLYKISKPVPKAAIRTDAQQQEDAEEGSKMMVDSTDDEGALLGTSSSDSFIMRSESEQDVSTVTPNGASSRANGSQESSGSVYTVKPEFVQQPVANENGATARSGSEEMKSPQKQTRKQQETLQTLPVPYSEEDRFKPSPTVDQKTVTMIIKQVIKSDKSIFQLIQPHLMSTRNQLNDFVECVSVQRERMKQFVADFLNEFIFLKGQNANDDLTNARLIVDYNRSMREGNRYRNKSERKMNLLQSKTVYPDVAHQWLCNGKLLRLLDPLDVHNYRVFHDQWERGQPVMVSAVSSKMNMDLWMPASFGRDFGEQMNDLINCLNGKIVRGHPMRVFWEGFEELSERLVDERERPMMLKLKDWPPGDDFAEMMPSRFYDLMKSLPLAEYTRREGRLNLASRLCSFFVRPDLGPKMYSAYGSALHPNKGTTNLHLDISDAVNVMVYVGVPKDVPSARYNEKIVELIDSEDCDYLTRQRVRERKELPGALWHIYHAQDADKIRALLNRIEIERGGTIKPNHDPIHDQKWYLDRNMRKRLQQEYQVEGYAIVQCAGDAIFIPAGAPHQVRNLHNCIKVAEDFVSPENISHCLKLTNEFRHLSGTHSNHEDKLQIKNIIYHTVKDAVSCITNPLIKMAAGEL